MLSIAFWNLNGNGNALQHVACLCGGADGLDVVLLAECRSDLRPTLDRLNALGRGVYWESANTPTKVRAITRLPPSSFSHQYLSTGREMTIWSVRERQTASGELSIAAVHLPSKMGGKIDGDQLSIASEVAEELADFEDGRGHRDTLLIGDMNMPPYDPGMTSAKAIHGLMTENLARMPDRIHRQQPRRRFYNPMWGLLGDRTPGASGSYYWESDALSNPFWIALDQALVRPSLIGALAHVEILRGDGAHSLLGPDGRPNRAEFSDHLPVLCRLAI